MRVDQSGRDVTETPWLWSASDIEDGQEWRPTNGLPPRRILSVTMAPRFGGTHQPRVCWTRSTKPDATGTSVWLDAFLEWVDATGAEPRLMQQTVASLLGAEIAGPVNVPHGQIESAAAVQPLIEKLLEPNRIQFFASGRPVPQPRPRAQVIWRGPKTNWRNATATVRECDSDHAVIQWKRLVKDCWRCDSPVKLTGPLSASLVFSFPRPETLVWKVKPMPQEWEPRAVGDLDNLAKAVLDALNGLAYDDDRQVVSLSLAKVMAGGEDQSGVKVTICELLERPQGLELPAITAQNKPF